MAKFYGPGRTFKKGKGGIPAREEDLNLIRDSIFQALKTGKNERVMRPTFGSSLKEMLFEAQGPVLNSLVIREVQRMLQRYEPRAQILEVKPVADGTKLTIDITYVALGLEQQTTITL